MKYNIEKLKGQQCRGVEMEYLFFWQIRNTKHNHIGKDCLSQWYPCKFYINGIDYNCAEQYMMAEKARLFGDEIVRRQILSTDDPKTIKKLGKLVSGFDEIIWENASCNIVRMGNIFKFGENKELREFLLSTGNKILVETSPYDKNWGIGLYESDENATNPQLWKGRNKLGFTLMEVRDILQETEKALHLAQE